MSSDIDEYERELEKAFERDFPEIARSSRRRDPFSLVTLGYSETLGEDLTLDEVERLKHSHTIGTTGSGKTNYLASLIKQDIDRGRGVMLLDPHGGDPATPRASSSLYSTILEHCTRRRLHQAGKLHIIDPSHDGSVSGFNPLAPIPGYTPDVLAMLMRECVERVWQQDIHATPSIARVLLGTFAALAELRLTLCDARILLKRDDQGLRRYALTHIKNVLAREVLEDLEELAERRSHSNDFDIETKGPRNRVSEFANNDAIRAIIGQTENLIDLVRIMDQGHVLLVNLQWTGRNATTNARVLGTMLLRYLFALAPRRTNAIPFFVYIDECQNFLTNDIPNLLREVRKHRIGIHLAHQDMQSLTDAGEAIRGAVINNTSVKTIFRMTDATEARDLMDRFAPSLDYEMPVKLLIKPTAVGQEMIWLESEGRADHKAKNVGLTEIETQTRGRALGEGEQFSEADTESNIVADTSSDALSSASQFGSGFGDSISQSIIPDAAFMGTGFPATIGTVTPNTVGLSASHNDITTKSFNDARMSAQAHSEAHGKAHTTGYARSFMVVNSEAFARGIARALSNSTGETLSKGRAQALATIYQDLPTAVHSRDTVLDMMARTLTSLRPGEASITIPNHSTLIRVPLTKTPELSRSERERLIEETLKHSPYAQPLETVQRSEEVRRKTLADAAAKTAADTPEPDDWSERFWNPEVAQDVVDRASDDKPKPSKPTLVVDNDKPDDEPEKPKT